MDWREKLFGKVLVSCEGGAGGAPATVPTLRALAACAEDGDDGAICGVYFSFANISDASDDFGPRLEQLFRRLRGRLQVVQVVLWAHVGTPEGPAEREAGFRRSLLGKPWFAVPFHDIDTKRRLTQKYKIAVGVPTLVVRGRHVREALLADPEGARFPWAPPPLADVLRGLPLRRDGGGTITYDHLPHDAVRLFYFAAHWCPPCRSFAPSLCATLAAVRKRRAKYANCQLIIVSSDRSEQSYERTLASLAGAGGAALPWGAAAARAALTHTLNVGGIPALLAVDAAGRLLAADARARLAADPLGLNFPWAPQPVTVLTEQALLKLARHPALVLFVEDEDSELEFAESVLTPAAESYSAECTLLGGAAPSSSDEDDAIDFDYTTTKPGRAARKPIKQVLFYIGVEGTAAGELLREHAAADDALPLLTALDFPKQRMHTMRYGEEISTHSVQNFLDLFLSGNAEFKPLRPYTEKC